LFKVLLDGAEVGCRMLRKNADEMPAVGDWVRVDSTGAIVEILPRRNVMARKAAGTVRSQRQVIAANIDHAFIVTSMNEEFNPRRIERYLTFLQLQNIECSLILTKADICDDAAAFLAQVDALHIPHPPICTSVVDGTGFDAVLHYATPDKTLIFIGSSGVGKSSIINHLMGQDVMHTSAISVGGDKGRHTTTHREMLIMPNGAAIIDSPGMRELQLWSGEGEITAFEDIEGLTAGCKFRNCSHKSEPDCAVKDAVESGVLTAQRLQSYEKMMKEAARVRLSSKN